MAASADDDYEDALKPQGRRLLEQISLPQCVTMGLFSCQFLIHAGFVQELCGLDFTQLILGPSEVCAGNLVFLHVRWLHHEETPLGTFCCLFAWEICRFSLQNAVCSFA
jgi:hypothetical protein